jgi:hypothetical protein
MHFFEVPQEMGSIANLQNRQDLRDFQVGSSSHLSSLLYFESLQVLRWRHYGFGFKESAKAIF